MAKNKSSLLGSAVCWPSCLFRVLLLAFRSWRTQSAVARLRQMYTFDWLMPDDGWLLLHCLFCTCNLESAWKNISLWSALAGWTSQVPIHLVWEWDMVLQFCFACCSGVENLPLPLPQLTQFCQRIAFKLSQSVQQPSRALCWDPAPILQRCVPIPFCKLRKGRGLPSVKLEKGRGLGASHVSEHNHWCSKGAVVPRAVDDCEVCYINRCTPHRGVEQHYKLCSHCWASINSVLQVCPRSASRAVAVLF